MTRSLLLVALVACAGNARQLEVARQSRYDAGLAVIHAGVVEATKSAYPNLDGDEEPTRTIKTAWHQITTPTEPARERGRAERYFIRFDITIDGDERPWRVEVVGYGSKWVKGMTLPTELRGADEPGWVTTRTDALRLKIHEQLAPYAVMAPADRPGDTPR